MKKIDNAVLHCSASFFGNDDFIRKIHVDENGWKDIGYNIIIGNGLEHSYSKYNESLDGKIYNGRGLDFSEFIEYDEIGAHALGYNNNSIGICLIGIDTFTVKQYRSLYYVIKTFKNINPNIKILGHCETPKSGGKTCPNINMDNLRDFINNNDYVLDGDIMTKLEVA